MVLVLEKEIEFAANKILKAEGWLIEKVKFANAGYPDRIYIHISGVVCWIEWKRAEKQTKPYPLQQVRILELIARQQNACWSDNANDGIEFCRQALAAKRLSDSRYQNAARAGSGGPVFRSRIRENEPRTGSVKNIESEGSNF